MSKSSRKGRDERGESKRIVLHSTGWRGDHHALLFDLAPKIVAALELAAGEATDVKLVHGAACALHRRGRRLCDCAARVEITVTRSEEGAT